MSCMNINSTMKGYSPPLPYVETSPNSKMNQMYYLTYLPGQNQGLTSPSMLLDKEKIATASTPAAPKVDTSKHYHIFVGDLAPELDADSVRAAFAPFGEISECKIIRDPQTMKSKGYGFVTFVNKKDAENAIASMNGQWLGSRAIRTNWATRKPPQPIMPDARPEFTEIFGQSSNTNCTVYCGGMMQNLSEDLIKDTFKSYGPIMEVRVFKEKGYCFVRYENKEQATQAIIGVNGTDVGGQIVKCAWGKESNENPGVQSASSVMDQLMQASVGGLQYMMPQAQSQYYYQQPTLPLAAATANTGVDAAALTQQQQQLQLAQLQQLYAAQQAAQLMAAQTSQATAASGFQNAVNLQASAWAGAAAAQPPVNPAYQLQ